MAGRTISAHLDEALARRFEDITEIENRPYSQIVGIAIKSFLDLSPTARRAAFSLEESATSDEQDFAARLLSRALLRGYQTIIENRYFRSHEGDLAQAGTNAEISAEEEIEDEAVPACRM